MQESRICTASGQPFTIMDEDFAFYDKVSPIIGGKKYLIPPPTLCPDERQRRRLAFQNITHLYKRPCSATGKLVISNYSADKQVPVYDNAYWYSDAWDSRSYGREYDFSRSFFEQFGELLNAVPAMARSSGDGSENSDYTNYSGPDKNCYLIFHANNNTDCLYSFGLKHATDCLDCMDVLYSELCYECLDCTSCYNLAYSQDCYHCSDSAFLSHCVNCRNCFGCANLRNQEYHVYNKPVSPEEFEQLMRQFRSGSYAAHTELRNTMPGFFQTLPVPALRGLNNEQCTGDHLTECNNVYNSFECEKGQNLKYCHRLYCGPNVDCYDIDQFGNQLELAYEAGSVGNQSRGICFVFCGVESADVCYGHQVRNSKNCFGCVSLQNAEYCILNKQYTKQEYEELVPRIIAHMQSTGEWGEFFPMTLSPFAYNESFANDHFPLTCEQIRARGLIYKEDEPGSIYEGVAPVLPDAIGDAADSITSGIYTCTSTGKHYRITKQELALYRTIGVPLPRLCPDARHMSRVRRRNPSKLFGRVSSLSGVPLLTSFPPEYAGPVYSAEEYVQEVSG